MPRFYVKVGHVDPPTLDGWQGVEAEDVEAAARHAASERGPGRCTVHVALAEAMDIRHLPIPVHTFDCEVRPRGGPA